MTPGKNRLLPAAIAVLLFGAAEASLAQTTARDPGVRGGPPGAGGPLAGLTDYEIKYFEVGKEDFEEAEDVADGLGPRMNLNSCGGCHIAPASGGSSPAVNPQMAFGAAGGDHVPFFIAADGPIREARLKFNPDGSRNGGVRNTASITGRPGAEGCVLPLDDFDKEAANDNLIFRIPTPLFGAGLIEQIPDSAILANLTANAAAKSQLGIGGRPNRARPGRVTGETNRNGNDGTVSRFGWKAQNQSLLLFSGEAYNVEMGITNPLFQSEREQDPACQFATVPNDITDPAVAGTPDGLGAIEKFAFFQRFLAPPAPSADQPGGAASIASGRRLFASVGCALCHTPTLTTGPLAAVAALRNQDVDLYSDLMLHGMGPGLADDIEQGEAQGDEFRTAPLWGVGQRLFFLHDGRTSDLLVAIRVHRSAGNAKWRPSEANAVIDRFDRLRPREKQDILNFLRSL